MKLTIELPENRAISNDIDWHFVRHEMNRVTSISVREILRAAVAAYDAQKSIEVGDLVYLKGGDVRREVIAVGVHPNSEITYALIASLGHGVMYADVNSLVRVTR